MYKIWKYFEKDQVIAYDYRTQETARKGPDMAYFFSKVKELLPRKF